MMKNKILLFGAKGFIGRNIEDYAKAHGIALISAYRTKDGSTAASDDNHFDLLNDDSYLQARTIVDKIKPDLVINAIASGVASHIDESISNRVNIEWPSTLAQICDDANVKGLIHFGSCAEYGNIAFEPPETTELKPLTPYGISKAKGTSQLLKANVDTLKIMILRLYPVFGLYEQPTKIFPVIMNSLLGNVSVDLGDKSKIRNYSYSKDIAEIIFSLSRMALSQKMPNVINIGSNTNLSLEEWSSRFAKTYGNPINKHLLNWGVNESSASDPDFMAPDLSLLKSLTGTSLEISSHAYADTVQYWMDIKNEKPSCTF